MPFGLKNSGATFQFLMDRVLGQLKWNTAIVYLDDIVIYGPTWEQHLVGVRAVFDRLRDANLTVKASKCNFAVNELKVLGFVV